MNAIAGVVPAHDVHQLFIDWAEGRVEDPRLRKLFMRMAERRGIEHRWSVLPPAPGGLPHDRAGRLLSWRHAGHLGAGWRLYAEEAPELALRAIAKLEEQADLTASPIWSWRAAPASSRRGSTRSSPAALGLDNVERTLVGFMGCYAAVSALRTAYHIVRSEPGGAGAGGDGRALHAASAGDARSWSPCSPCCSSATAPPRLWSAPSRKGSR